ncbi:hypothetical protein DSN97_03915 [Deferribacteraceae bacterium V6Fe1]|nr:hypothetical protein DSN97_03915 [Deferribacteraceae bacterium V6Fe1]
MSISPTDILILRATCFKENKPEIIFDLYHEESEFKKIFGCKHEYAEHFKNVLSNLTHSGIKIISEQTKHKLSEVKYIEHFVDNQNELLIYYCKSYFKIQDGEWLIFKEIKELKGRA